MKNKKSILLVIILMVVGFAAVSTTLYINGSTKINPNQEDFNVYYSDALVNGIRDLSVVESKTVLTFTTTLKKLGEKYELDYDVTNGSKNYDAELVMECTGYNEYLTVTNEFDDETILKSSKTRRGKLTLELIKSYSGETDMNITIACTINANAVERDSIENETPETPVVPAKYAIGDEITISGEIFNVISEDKESIRVLAQYSLDSTYRQTKSTTYSGYARSFASINGWEYTPGPKEINIQSFEGNAKKFVNEYVLYIQSELGSNEITGDLITFRELKNLGCTIVEDYSWDASKTCVDSKYSNWLVNGQDWWTRSAASFNDYDIWYVLFDGRVHDTKYTTNRGIRPVIIIPKNIL